jgi:serine protease AprX
MEKGCTQQSRFTAWNVARRTAFLFVALLFVFSLQAQSLDQRREIQKGINTVGLGIVKAEFLRQYQEDEKSVADYLAKNPLVTRSFEKNGSTYFMVRVDKAGNPFFINTKNRESGMLIKADQMYSGGSLGINITGTGMVAGVWDGGQVRATHELLSGRVTMQAGQTVNSGGGNDHMTHVSGTIVGKDITAQPSARGIAHNATALCYDWDNDLVEMSDFAGLGHLVSNHSYGPGNTTEPEWFFGAYDGTARAWDALLKNTPNYLPFVAAGNEQQSSNNRTQKLGYDIMTAAAASKNVMTVGALNADKSMSDYSNWGPTDDGRVKPEIVTKGTGINSSQYTGGDAAYSGNGENSSGTSYATPAAAAGALLLQQYYNSLHGSYMKASTLKALMLHTAEDLGQPGPDPKFGWGLLDLEKASRAIKAKGPISFFTSTGAYIEEIAANPVNNSADEIIRYVYASGSEPLVLSIAWTDDEGTEQTSAEGVDPTASRLVYDFDVLVHQVSPFMARRPWKPQTMAGRLSDATFQTGWFDGNGNNYKQVVFPTPVADGEYRIFIRKKSTSPAAARTISLVVTGLKVNTPATCPTLTAAPANVSIVNSTCNSSCQVTGGSISAPTGTPCPAGSTLQYNVNNTGWTNTLPTYAQTGPAQSIQTRCNCNTDNTMSSPASTAMVTMPGDCGSGTPTVTQAWATLASGAGPSAIAIDASGNVYTANLFNNTVSKITPAGGVTQAWATLDSGAQPYGIAIDASGNVYTSNRQPYRQ